MGILNRNLFRRPTSASSHLDLVVLNLDAALGNIGVRGLAGDMLTLLNHGELLGGANGLDLVPAHDHIPRDVAVKGHAATDLAQQLAGQLIAVGEEDNIRSGRSSFAGIGRATLGAQWCRRDQTKDHRQDNKKLGEGAAGESGMRHRGMGTFLER